jgi:hypothetical protein
MMARPYSCLKNFAKRPVAKSRFVAIIEPDWHYNIIINEPMFRWSIVAREAVGNEFALVLEKVVALNEADAFLQLFPAFGEFHDWQT